MSGIPIFDSLTHPTLNGAWLAGSSCNAGLDELVVEMRAAEIRWAFAVGMQGVGDYEFERYAAFVTERAANLFPIAYCEFERFASEQDVAPWLRKVQTLGYRGVKIHPRFSTQTLDAPLLERVIRDASQCGLLVFLCTHLVDARHVYENRFENLVRLLTRVAEARIVLLHGGVIRVLELLQAAKAIGNKLLDLSYTISKYRGSSVDLDIAYLFAQCDRGICVGSDHPEYRSAELRERFEHFARDLTLEQSRNIAYGNLMRFAGLSLETS